MPHTYDADAFLEDYRYLLATGEHPDRIAGRLNLSEAAFKKRLHNLGEPTPWTLLQRRQAAS